ncbi:hypothetical protein [Microcoleus sp. CAWBG27]|uniref:hypothetical protein n=1 Tax=Microcoleus sp. CAWBG27 TaxID=2841645 RepID=UPI0025CC118F|nr:hypothetical protein [Microcoleus sp. CAWBG27]
MAKKIPPDMAELSVYVDKKLKLQFKLACTAQEKPMSEVVGLLMKQWLEIQARDSRINKIPVTMG